MEDTKNIKDDKKEKESPDLKDKLSEEELSEVSGGSLSGNEGGGSDLLKWVLLNSGPHAPWIWCSHF